MRALRHVLGFPGLISVAGAGKDRVVKVDGQVAPFDVRQGLAGGQVVDGDFVALPVGAGGGNVADFTWATSWAARGT
jgi:hypothetical protein